MLNIEEIPEDNEDNTTTKDTERREKREAKAFAIVSVMLFLIAVPLILGFFGIDAVKTTVETKQTGFGTTDWKATVETRKEINTEVAIPAFIVILVFTCLIYLGVYEIIRA